MGQGLLASLLRLFRLLLGLRLLLGRLLAQRLGLGVGLALLLGRALRFGQANGLGSACIGDALGFCGPLRIGLTLGFGLCQLLAQAFQFLFALGGQRLQTLALSQLCRRWPCRCGRWRWRGCCHRHHRRCSGCPGHFAGRRITAQPRHHGFRASQIHRHKIGHACRITAVALFAHHLVQHPARRQQHVVLVHVFEHSS